MVIIYHSKNNIVNNHCKIELYFLKFKFINTFFKNMEINNHSLINSCVNYVPTQIVWTKSHDDSFNSSNYMIAGKYDINKKVLT